MAPTKTVVGSYPKPPDEGGRFSLRKTLQEYQRGSAGDAEVQRVKDELVREVVAEQARAGIDVVTDGHVRWDDLITPFTRNMAGFETGGLFRWFDNNVYYRRPICVGEIEWRGPSSVESWRYAQSVSPVPVKAVLPGPITLAHLSVDEHYDNHVRFTEAIAAVLAQEVFELQAAGASFIQIDEPALLGAPEELALARDSIARITDELEVATILCTYFGDAKRLGADLFELPVDSFGLDFVSGPDNWELINALPASKGLQAGIVDARNTRLEDATELAAKITRLTAATEASNVSVAPSAGLEFLPREKARAKLELLTEAVARADA